VGRSAVPVIFIRFRTEPVRGSRQVPEDQRRAELVRTMNSVRSTCGPLFASSSVQQQRVALSHGVVHACTTYDGDAPQQGGGTRTFGSVMRVLF
jgi:hypothetical protein